MSTPEKATAIVLKTVDFSETSSILTLFSREFGKMSGLAKGARRPKGPFESALDLLSTSRIVFLRKSGDSLHLLTEAKLERRFRPVTGDLSSLYGGYYVAELLSELTDDFDPHPELFDAAQAALTELGKATSITSTVLRFELRALTLLGHLPSLNECVECGRQVVETARIAFGQLSGGVLCQECRLGKKQVVSVSAGVIQVLRLFADQSSDQWRTMAIAPPIRGELRAVVNQYFANLLGHRPRMHSYLGSLSG